MKSGVDPAILLHRYKSEFTLLTVYAIIVKLILYKQNSCHRRSEHRNATDLLILLEWKMSGELGYCENNRAFLSPGREKKDGRPL